MPATEQHMHTHSYNTGTGSIWDIIVSVSHLRPRAATSGEEMNMSFKNREIQLTEEALAPSCSITGAVTGAADGRNPAPPRTP